MWKNPRGRQCGVQRAPVPQSPQSFHFLSLSSWFPSLNSALIPIFVSQLHWLLILWSSTRSLFYFRQKERGKELGHNPLRTFPVLIPEDFSLHLIGYLFLQGQLNFFFFFWNHCYNNHIRVGEEGKQHSVRQLASLPKARLCQRFCFQLFTLGRREQGTCLQNATDMF